jgi:hypothetical protein
MRKKSMFRLVVSVRRGSASGMPGAWERYPTLEQARSAAATLLKHERVARVAIVRNEAPPAFVEWRDR